MGLLGHELLVRAHKFSAGEMMNKDLVLQISSRFVNYWETEIS